MVRALTGRFRSDWGAEFFASVRSVVGTAARHGLDAYTAIRNPVAPSLDLPRPYRFE